MKILQQIVSLKATKLKSRFYRYVGVAGAIAFIVAFASNPSFPTPDKILVFLTFVFMAIGQAKQLLKHLLPFVVLLLAYESFRGVADSLNSRVNFLWMPLADNALFGSLPTAKLQEWLWHGRVQWYDFALYLPYMLHFVLPLILALIIWKKREEWYWRYVASFVLLSFTGFLTFLLFPAAPPWMASEMNLIEPITRISSNVWFALGISDFPSVYNKISPNAVAAVPSLHAAYATLFALYVIKLFKNKWRLISLIYPAAIYFGTVYQGEHYAIDAIIGSIYAAGSYFLVKHSWPRLKKITAKFWQ